MYCNSFSWNVDVNILAQSIFAGDINSFCVSAMRISPGITSLSIMREIHAYQSVSMASSVFRKLILKF